MAQFFTFRGRVGRQEYWLTVIAGAVVLFAAGVLLGVTGGFGLVVAAPLYGLMLWATLAMMVRRLHDRGRSGWWLLLMMGPQVVLGGLGAAASATNSDAGAFFNLLSLPFSLWVLIDLGCLPGKPGPNRFGSPMSRPGAAAEVFD